MTQDEESQGEKRFLPRWVLVLALPGLLGPLLILGFIFRSELAHDEARCPYQRVSEQVISADIRVQEDRRSCVPDVEEHRYTLVRGREQRVLGRRRLPPSAFQGRDYTWKASLSEQGEVQVVVQNPLAHGGAKFREGTPADRGE